MPPIGLLPGERADARKAIQRAFMSENEAGSCLALDQSGYLIAVHQAAASQLHFISFSMTQARCQSFRVDQLRFSLRRK
jgi:hypothetical protein